MRKNNGFTCSIIHSYSSNSQSYLKEKYQKRKSSVNKTKLKKNGISYFINIYENIYFKKFPLRPLFRDKIHVLTGMTESWWMDGLPDRFIHFLLANFCQYIIYF